MSKQYYVYIMTNQRHTVFYTGVTNDLARRVFEHKQKMIAGFTKRYNVIKLIYYEVFLDINEAIAREKQVKDYRREKKFQLIREMNPNWKDLADEF